MTEATTIARIKLAKSPGLTTLKEFFKVIRNEVGSLGIPTTYMSCTLETDDAAGKYVIIIKQSVDNYLKDSDKAKIRELTESEIVVIGSKLK